VSAAASQLRDEVVELARDLIRVDTSNPPGNETPAAELLAAYLRGAGIEQIELVGPDPARLNLVARIPGAGEGPSLMLLAHTDVVPAPPYGWSVDPFEGAVRDERLIGRGAVDMKNELAARAAAFAAVARSGEPPPGDLVLVAESDEERNGSDVGMSWLVRERPDLRCELALNEGGGCLLELAGGGRVVPVSIGEKVVTAVRLRMLGTGGHASIPGGADNPLGHAASAIERLLADRPPLRLEAELSAALIELGAPPGDDAALIAWAGAENPTLGRLVAAAARMTIVPTGALATEPPNVIPPFADVVCDCRALPGEGEGEIRARIDAVLGDSLRYEVEFLEPPTGGTRSSIESPLYAVLERYLAARAPGARALPLVDAGFTDSHWVRDAWGTVAYGFAPVLHDDPGSYLDAAHSTDESLSLDDLVEMAEFHLFAIRELVGS
jgi:acetylornithine deacetylase/succinyl-diaminopimelate desuccinylase-like protein